jgi:SpoVK/Ycf46/Vps4 family AAA+-type ATPase
VLFAGDSGTGKTMSAEVIAGDLGLDLFTINLSTVVDKYIGETEKNLERIFTEADEINGVLLFDEADALFGKRSEVRDAHDRYANMQVAYLLQRLETFDGLAVLSTNLRSNIDDAFARRLDAVVEFPMPDVAERRLLWSRCLGPRLPLADDVDLDFCATSFPLSGGNIRSIALTAAYMAAEGERAVEMLDLMRATHREYRKLGRLKLESEFGGWLSRIGP